MSTNWPDKTITDKLVDLQDALNVSDEAYTDLLGIGSKEYEKIRNHEANPSVYMIDQLCQNLNVDFDSFVEGQFDVRHFKRQLGGEPSLPEHYADPSLWFARGRTIIGIRKFIETNYGVSFCRSVFRKVYLDPEWFRDTESFVNPYMVTDLLASFSSFGFHSDWACEIGFFSHKVNRNTRMQDLIMRTKGPVELYQLVHEELTKAFYDSLFEYHLVSLSEGQMVTEALPRAENHALLKQKVAGTRAGCLYKQGAYLSLAKQRGLPIPKLVESACLYRGDDRCRYHFSW